MLQSYVPPELFNEFSSKSTEELEKIIEKTSSIVKGRKNLQRGVNLATILGVVVATGAIAVAKVLNQHELAEKIMEYTLVLGSFASLPIIFGSLRYYCTERSYPELHYTTARSILTAKTEKESLEVTKALETYPN